MHRCKAFIIIIAAMGLLLASGAIALAQEPALAENETCLTCHSNPDMAVEFPDGSSRSGHVSGTRYHSSVHGEQGMTCAGCHPDNTEYPHPAVTSPDNRTYTLEMNETCVECHPSQAELVNDSIHSQFLNEGEMNAAVCVDCHSAHYVISLKESRVQIAQTCRKCHASIYDKYNNSVHGKALREEGNTDVPTCVDCHGIHSIEDPRTAEFRLKSPAMCGSCHADEELMGKYDISTDVFNTYVADFHGTTVTLFEKQSPDAATNKAVCYDCHGIHDITSAEDVQENLQQVCQKCHPDANESFPESWTSHYPRTFEKQPLVAIVDLFYAIVIPATLGAMGVFVVLDAGKRISTRIKKGKNSQPAETESNNTDEQEEA